MSQHPRKSAHLAHPRACWDTAGCWVLPRCQVGSGHKYIRSLLHVGPVCRSPARLRFLGPNDGWPPSTVLLPRVQPPLRFPRDRPVSHPLSGLLSHHSCPYLAPLGHVRTILNLGNPGHIANRRGRGSVVPLRRNFSPSHRPRRVWSPEPSTDQGERPPQHSRRDWPLHR